MAAEDVEVARKLRPDEPQALATLGATAWKGLGGWEVEVGPKRGKGGRRVRGSEVRFCCNFQGLGGKAKPNVMM